MQLLIVIAALGCIAMTVGFPLLAAYLWRRTLKQRSTSRAAPPLRRIAVLIPVHNDGEGLSITLDSIRAARARLHHSRPEIDVNLLVACDGCNDDSAVRALAAGAWVLEAPERQGKWRTIEGLVRSASHADWVVLADAGSVWPPELLERIARRASSAAVLAVAPAYQNPSHGFVERLLWTFEQRVKHLECAAGGPVSIHGASVAYRRRPLQKALRVLTKHAWLNDDVVIPLVLRALYPRGVISYERDLAVCDAPSARSTTYRPWSEFARRCRIVRGNGEWMRSLIAPLWQRNTPAALLAMRRCARVFWAYWALLGTLSVLTLLQVYAGVTLTDSLAVLLFIVVATYGVIAPLRAPIEAGIASLIAPLLLLPRVGREAVWR